MSEQIAQKDHNLENQLIIECSKTKNSASQVEKISHILQQPLDWEYIVKIAEKNCVLPLVSWNLLQNFADSLTGKIADELNIRFRMHTQRNLTLTKKLVDVINLFNSNNIPLISFKGPLLAVQGYENLALRQFNDLDILVPPNHIDAAIDLLISSGFIPMNDLHWFEKKDWYLSRKKDVIFVDEKREYILELHWKLSGAHFAYPIEIEKLWQNIETTELAGVDVNVLHFNDLFIYLCLHGSRHSWERLSWICDLNELINSKSEIDWEQISKDAKRLGCENILGFGLFLVHKFFGTKVEVANWQKITDNQIFKDLSEQIERMLFAEESTHLDITNRYSYHLKLKERPWDRFKLHLHYNLWYLQLIFSPNKLDKETFNLPSAINPVYYVIRPLRLFYTYFIKSK